MTITDPKTLVLSGARLVTPVGLIENRSLLIEDGLITRIDDDERLRAAGPVLVLDGQTVWPGFIDVHIHGAVGIDVMTATVDELAHIGEFLARSGVTTWLPTLVPGADSEYKHANNSIEELMKRQEDLQPAARAVGVHYEGPFVNTNQCGALRTQFFRTFTNVADLEPIVFPQVEGARRMMTLAPEIEGGVALVAELVRRGWVISIGHTRAGVDVLDAARNAGARHMTHFPNAMAPLHHRSPGPIGWGLLQDDVTVDLIADGVHCDPLMIKLVMRCKSSERFSLISDSVSPTGLGDGDYRVWGETITVRQGKTSNERGSIAGSVITMRDAVNMMLSLGIPEFEVARIASLNPARLLGLDSVCGSIEVGKRADLTALDSACNVSLCVVGGRIAAR